MSKTINTSSYANDYSDSSFWDKVRKVAHKAGYAVLFKAFELYYVLVSGKLNAGEVTLVAGALAYFILPIDLIPDFLVPIGYTDDLSALVGAYKMVASKISSEETDKARESVNDLLA